MSAHILKISRTLPIYINVEKFWLTFLKMIIIFLLLTVELVWSIEDFWDPRTMTFGLFDTFFNITSMYQVIPSLFFFISIISQLSLCLLTLVLFMLFWAFFLSSALKLSPGLFHCDYGHNWLKQHPFKEKSSSYCQMTHKMLNLPHNRLIIFHIQNPLASR